VGAILAWWLHAAWQVMPALRLLRPADWLFLVLAAGVSACALVGGGAVLLKGRAAWALSVAAFGMLCLAEAIGAAYGAGMIVHCQLAGDVTGAGLGAVLLGVMTALMSLGVIVLRYLASSKARVTFALPPGEAPVIARWAPAAVIVAYALAVAVGMGLGPARFWTGR